ncbi:hypothetical protein E6H18_00155 [Candidatus Bathyarchaeota archaeon]|nr:MAG: hypothetical protein E6H18_00155 [Candidatus Bathyarchaeota archaeon]
MSESFRFKQVLIVRLDLDMGRGKAAVQCAHAAVSAAELVRDRGLTQVPPGTITCLGLGPAPADLLDSLTGNLTLL